MTKILNKKIVVGVCGGIAAYKTCELVSLLRKGGAEVNVVMTEAALQFVSPTTFSALTGRSVHSKMFDTMERIPHIELVQEADLVVVAPATANCIGKFANGIADDLLTTLLLAAVCPVFFAPAMNVNMYTHRIVQENMSKLQQRGVTLLEPGEGMLACGTEGKGRMMEPKEIYDAIMDFFLEKDLLRGLNIMVTAGGTREPIDPVRFIGNRSSGKMGHAIAAMAQHLGAYVTLITTVKQPDRQFKGDIIHVETAKQMHDQALNKMEAQDVIIMAAAVADYAPAAVEEKKIKKKAATLVLTLEKTPDILANLGKHKDYRILIGFAAETENLKENAMEKLRTKNLDLIIANDVSNQQIGFDSDHNQIEIYSQKGCMKKTTVLPKEEIAKVIFSTMAELETYKNLKDKKKGEDYNG